MQKYKVLVITDHSGHSAANSLYILMQGMLKSAHCGRLDVMSRGVEKNNSFFAKGDDSFYVTEVVEGVAYSPEGNSFYKDLLQAKPSDYDLVWLRLPPPLSEELLELLERTFSKAVIINRPRGIYKTGSKAFLEEFSSVCPPLKLCSSIEDIATFKEQFPIVLKPLNDYGGRGLVRIDGNRVQDGDQLLTWEDFVVLNQGKKLAYLAVKFLENVSKGDKRIVVVNGKIIGASLRLPAEGSWLCNASQGGSSINSTVDPEEEAIVKLINPKLEEQGVVMYGVDTLVGDDGKRQLSEINTTSIGGVLQIRSFRQEPIEEEIIGLIWSYFLKQKEHAQS